MRHRKAILTAVLAQAVLSASAGNGSQTGTPPILRPLMILWEPRIHYKSNVEELIEVRL